MIQQHGIEKNAFKHALFRSWRIRACRS